MMRASFGGGSADFVFTASGSGFVKLTAAAMTLWSAESGGTQFTDLVLDGQATSVIPVGVDGQIPTFEGPDNVLTMWADAGGGRIQLNAAADDILAFTGGQGPGGGTGEVTGPSTMVVADRIAVFNGTSGKVIKQASVSVADLALIDSPDFVGEPTINGVPIPMGGDQGGSGSTGVLVAAPTGNVTNDTASVAFAQNLLRAKGRGPLVYQPGVYVLRKNVAVVEDYWHLRGPGATLRLADGENGRLITTLGYDAALAADDGRGPHSWSISDLILDGNRAGNTSGDVLSIYGFNFRLTDLEVFGGGGKGIVSRWSEGPGFYEAIADGAVGFCESYTSRVKVHDNDGGGIDWNGPHDPHFDGVYVYFNGPDEGPGSTKVGVHFGPEAYAPVTNNLHIYGNHHGIGLLCEAPYALMSNFTSEGAQVVQNRILATGFRQEGGHTYNAGQAQYVSTARGFDIGFGGVYVDQVVLRGTITNCEGGAIAPWGEGSSCRYDLAIYQNAGTVFPTLPGMAVNPTRQITYSQNGNGALGDPGGRDAVIPGGFLGTLKGGQAVYDTAGTIIGYRPVYDTINPALSLLLNPGFETSTAGWTAKVDNGTAAPINATGTLTRSTAWKFSGAASGYFVGVNNTAANAFVGPEAAPVAVNGGSTYRATVAVNLIDDALPGDVTLKVAWFNSAGTFLSNVMTTAYGSPGAKTISTAAMLAPPTAATALIRVQVVAGAGETKRFYVDNVIFYDANNLGDTPDGGGNTGGYRLALDTDGVPYFSSSQLPSTIRILADTDGVPYFTAA